MMAELDGSRVEQLLEAWEQDKKTPRKLPPRWRSLVNFDNYCEDLYAALVLIENYTRGEKPGLNGKTAVEAKDYIVGYAKALMDHELNSQDFVAAAVMYYGSKPFFPTSPVEFVPFVRSATLERCLAENEGVAALAAHNERPPLRDDPEADQFIADLAEQNVFLRDFFAEKVNGRGSDRGQARRVRDQIEEINIARGAKRREVLAELEAVRLRLARVHQGATEPEESGINSAVPGDEVKEELA